MLKAKMNIDELRKWAEEHHVTDSLSLPIRVLQPKNIDKKTWLWLYHNGNLTFEQVLTRNTVSNNQNPDDWNIPLIYQTAAIEELQRIHQNILCAIEEEVIILGLQNTTFPGIQRSIDKLLKTRSNIRQEHFPRTQKERATGRIWFERNSCELVYKEEVQSWCGDGRWRHHDFQ